VVPAIHFVNSLHYVRGLGLGIVTGARPAAKGLTVKPAHALKLLAAR
jgi:hypothetical protein